ncbi:uncharacterized protein [Arachis hypogaea]|uniref:uncharacterized protein n=2 Tax=Arachis TaxID=3817 RepID=UPI000DEC555D|nr:uncharacterized protein LOC112727870 isoform X1 [Arachis hypogaea]
MRNSYHSSHLFFLFSKITMGKQASSKPRRPDSLGKGKVTPIQIAFIVDRYLCDNNYSETRTAFRNEASSLLTNSPIHEAPKSLLSLGELLDDYVCLKEQKVMVEQERVLVEQEKNRVQMLLNGIQNVMNAFNATTSSRSIVAPSNRTPPPGVSTTMQNASNVHSLPQPINTNTESANFSMPVLNLSDRKRKDTIAVDESSTSKKSRGKLSNRRIPFQVPGQNTLPQSDTSAITNQVASQPSTHHPSTRNSVLSESQVQGSTVSKCLFNQPSASVPTTTSPAPKTPSITTSSHGNTHISPPDIPPALNRNEEAAPSCYAVISTKRIMVSPTKQMAYIESSQCISPVKTGTSDKASNKRDHVRSRLDFGASGSELPIRSTSDSTKDVDLFDIDIDALGTDFSFTEMLNDLEGIDFSCNPASMSYKDNASGSSPECKGNQVISERSTVGEVSEEEMNVPGSDNCLNTMTSVTKCIKISTPVKSRQGSLDQ